MTEDEKDMVILETLGELAKEGHSQDAINLGVLLMFWEQYREVPFEMRLKGTKHALQRLWKANPYFDTLAVWDRFLEGIEKGFGDPKTK